MHKRVAGWKFLVLPIFIISLAATGYFGLQFRRSIPSPLAGPLAADKGYGVTLDLTQYERDALTDTLTTLHQQGLTWLRQPVEWAALESNPTEFNWTAYDEIFAAVAQANEAVAQPSDKFKLIVVLHTSPTWARPANTTPTTPPTDISNLGRFSRAFADRYADQIDYYQIWHEPNLSVNWGDTFVDPVGYTDLLREAAINIRTADPQAYILTAALAATLEDGPLNLNELAFLDQIYQAQGQTWFDIVAVQPYGLWTKPLDPPNAGQLNFRRPALVRQVMLAHGDADTPLWATAFGWVALPDTWTGRPSPWSQDLPAVQAPRTATAITHARDNWPWLGPMIAARWDTVGLAEDDPARGFALLETPEILQVIQTATTNHSLATIGAYPADHPSGQYSPGWRFARHQADIPRQTPRTLTIPFSGQRLDLQINRGLYRGYLWVTIDGQPANALPRDGQGHSYVVLYDPLYKADTVTLAHNLPAGRHKAVIEAEGGWEQWAIAGWVVSNQPNTRAGQTGLILAGLLTIFSGTSSLRQLLPHLPHLGKLIWAWSEIVVAFYAILGERAHWVIAFALGAGLYFLPGWGALALLPMLALVILLRPDIGLLLVTFSTFLFEIPVRLPIGTFSPVELTLTLTLFGHIFRGGLNLARQKYSSGEVDSQFPQPVTIQSNNLKSKPQNPKSTDWAALSLVVLALLATLAADNFAVSFREWRIVILESVIFYYLVRLGSDFSPLQLHAPDPQRWARRLIDVFIAGAVLQAVVALYFYFFTDQTIDAEGVRRALGLAGGSPNNLALILDRAWPLLLVVPLFARSQPYRRWLYGAGFAVVTLALYLTFSKGALLLGLPVCIIGLILLYGWHHYRQSGLKFIGTLGGGLLLLGLTLLPFSQTERFRATFNFNEGSTSFFRLKLWQASWTMLQDHWPLGIGPDNFLYHYRTRYILPEAWQEPNLNHPHNLFLDFGLRLGILGIGLLFWLQVAFWINAWHLYKRRFDPFVLGLMGSMLIFLSHGLVDNSYFLVDLAFAFFLTLGLIQGLGEHVQQTP